MIFSLCVMCLCMYVLASCACIQCQCLGDDAFLCIDFCERTHNRTHVHVCLSARSPSCSVYERFFIISFAFCRCIFMHFNQSIDGQTYLNCDTACKHKPHTKSISLDLIGLDTMCMKNRNTN